MNTENKLTDKSGDRKYFILTQRIVWALCDDPYDYTLWSVIKDIAGESGECFLSTPDLAFLSMMSAGRVSKSRKNLIDRKLLKGEIRRDPGYPQPVWHLEIPDLWEQNISWCLQYPGLKERIEYKKSFHHMKADENEKELSPGEGGITPNEKGVSPNETKNNYLEDRKEHPYKKGDLLDGLQDLYNTPGAKKSIIKEYISSRIQVRLTLNPSGKNAESFINYAADRKIKDRQDIDAFISWWLENFTARVYWSFQKMQENWPAAFVDQEPDPGERVALETYGE